MQPDDSSIRPEPDPTGSAGPGGAAARVPRLSLASAVMFVHELDPSIDFYRDLLGWDVTLRDNTAALLAGPGGFQLYLREMGPRTPHPLGQVGIQYLIWTANSEDELRRCERVLGANSAHVKTSTDDGFTVVEGRGPNHVPILITYPGPGKAHRHKIMQRIYEW